ncbi:MAG: ribonuclease BN [Desulfobulbus propionicus]|nr:MAG: ribonuclease BN [Desulfobulbus propionicus]
MKYTLDNRFFHWLDRERTDLSPIQQKLLSAARIIAITLYRFINNNLSLRSSAMTFTLLLSLVPMLAMSTAVVKGMGGGNQLKNLAYRYLDTLEESKGFALPDFGSKKEQQPETESKKTLTAWLRTVVDKVFDYVDHTNFATLGSFGVLGILLTALLMLNHIEKTMNVIWAVESGRSLMRKLSDYMTLLILFPLSINITFAASAILRHPEFSEKFNLIVPFDWMQPLVLQAVPIFFITISLSAVYIFFPNTRVKTVAALAGAFLAAVLWFIMQNVYITLQIGVAKYNAIYGTFASAPLFLVWIWLGWVFIFLGAQFAWAIQHHRRFSFTVARAEPALQLAAAFDISDSIYRNFTTGQAVTSQQVLEQINYSYTLGKEVLEKLVAQGLFHHSQRDDRLLPCLPEQAFDQAGIAKVILGQNTPDTEGGKKSHEAIASACNGIGR